MGDDDVFVSPCRTHNHRPLCATAMPILHMGRVPAFPVSPAAPTSDQPSNSITSSHHHIITSSHHHIITLQSILEQVSTARRLEASVYLHPLETSDELVLQGVALFPFRRKRPCDPRPSPAVGSYYVQGPKRPPGANHRPFVTERPLHVLKQLTVSIVRQASRNKVQGLQGPLCFQVLCH